MLPPETDATLTTYTNNTNNTDVIVNDNNNISTYSLDLVIPMNAPQQQVPACTICIPFLQLLTITLLMSTV